MSKRGWEAWEKEIQERLGLDSTICSGNKWHDQGDAVDNSNPQYNPFRLLVDCKFSMKGSFSVSRKKLQQWITSGYTKGKMPILAIRLWSLADTHPMDLVVLAYDDFEEIWEKARKWAQNGV